MESESSPHFSVKTATNVENQDTVGFKAQVTTMLQATIEQAKEDLMVTIKAMGETATIAPLSKEIADREKAASKGSNRTTMVEATTPIIPSSRLLAPMNLKNVVGMEEMHFGVTITAAGRRHMEQMTVMQMAPIRQMLHQMDQEAQVKLETLQFPMKVVKET